MMIEPKMLYTEEITETLLQGKYISHKNTDHQALKN